MAEGFDVDDLQKKYGGNKENIVEPFWPPSAKTGDKLVDAKYMAEHDIKQFYVFGPAEDGIFLTGDSNNPNNSSILNMSKISYREKDKPAAVLERKPSVWDKFANWMCCGPRDKKSEDLQKKVIRDNLNNSVASHKSRLRRDDDHKANDSKLNNSKMDDSKVGKSILKNTETRKKVPNGVTTNGN